MPIRASILHKQLKRGDPKQAQSAARRFQRLSHLAGLPVQAIVARKGEIQRKHALAVVAMENDYASWADLKHHFERQEKREALRQRSAHTMLYPPRCSGCSYRPSVGVGRYSSIYARDKKAHNFGATYRSGR